jgi:hypothetical protein
VTAARWAAVAAVAFALYFAIQGGEYGTTHLLQLRREVRVEESLVARLEVVVDSPVPDRPGRHGAGAAA